MKPKYRSLAKAALPSIIVFPAMMTLASAAVINPDGFGNVLITTSDSGANNIVVPAGQPAGPHEIRFDPGTSLTPPGVSVIDIRPADADGASYTVNNTAGGTIRAGGASGSHGITTASGGASNPNITVNNSGLIVGDIAINARQNLVLTNNGSVVAGGFNTAAVFANSGSITNNAGGSISGEYQGIESNSTTGLVNIDNASTITGNVGTGVKLAGDLFLFNRFSETGSGAATIRGGQDGVVATGGGAPGADIDNCGVIIGNTGDGVRVAANGNITNFTTFSMFSPFNAISGGQITGGTNGIVAGNNLTVLNQNLGRISGGTGNGISAGNNATITNNAGATINGGNQGVVAGAGLQLTNNGTITSGTGDGIRADGGSNTTINNNGTINSGQDGIRITNVAAGDVINNTGTITGGNDGIEFFNGGDGILNNSGMITGQSRSVYGSNSNDTFNLNLGSRLVGNVDGGFGTDVINFGAGISSPGGLGNSISGNVTRFTTINKDLGGVALIGLPGDALFNVTADTININSGGLYINADIAGDSVAKSTINAGGAAVGGTGTWNANVNVTAGGFSAGAIPINLDFNPSNSVGQVTVTGNVDHSPGSFIRFDVVPGTIINGVNSDLIRQTGAGNTYDVTGANIRIAATDNNRAIRNGTYTIVDSDEVITGVGTGALQVQFNGNVNSNDTFPRGSEIFNANPVGSTILTNFFSSLGTQNGGTNLVLNVNHNFSGLPGLNANESALGAALDASINTSSSITQDFIAALDYSSLGAVQATLASVIPDNVLASASALASDNYRLNRLVQDHLAMTRSGGAFIETPAMTDAKGGMIPATTRTSGGGMGNVWGTFSYDWRDSDFGATDIDGESASFTAGVDYRISPDLLVGFLLDGSQSDYDYTGGNSDVDSFRAVIYGTYGQSTGIYADFLIGYGNHDLDLNRNLGGILAGTSYNASTDADSLQALLTVGYAMETDGIKHGPFAGFEYQNIDVDGFSPSGVAATLGGVGSFDVDSFRLLVGYRAETTYGKFSPYASVTYAHEFEDGPIRATATIPGGASFGFSGGGVESAILISLGTGYAINANLGMNVGYHGEISTGDGVDSHGLAVGLNYSF